MIFIKLFLIIQNNIIISSPAWQKITLFILLILYGFTLFDKEVCLQLWYPDSAGKKHPKNQETKVRWPPVSVNTLLWWLPPWAETDGLYEFSPGGNKAQLCAPSTLQIMFIVELSVIKPITAEQIKASTRELISSQLSPSLNHGADLMPWLSSASRIEMGPSRLRYFYEIKQWISALIHFICGKLH